MQTMSRKCPWYADKKGAYEGACPAAATSFYDRYSQEISRIEAIGQRNNILSDMQQDFEAEVRQKPQVRDSLSGVYQVLKQKCMEAV